MADIFTKRKRSKIMSLISGKETKPEILVRKFLFSKGFRYRKNVATLAGKPNIVLTKYKTVIFVNGCFWHGHDCKAAKLPETRKEFWEVKINSNVVRDSKNIIGLQNQGWQVIVVWQCNIKNKTLFDLEMKQLIKIIKNDRSK